MPVSNEKMNINGQNADSSVIFSNSALTIGNRGLSYKQDIDMVWEDCTAIFPLPYKSWSSNAIVYNNKLHLLGGGNCGNNEHYKHYSFDGSTWVQESTLPFANSKYNNFLVHNNKIHAFYGQQHYTWDGTSWTHEEDSPYSVSVAAELNGYIYTVCYNNGINTMYKILDDGTWSDVASDGNSNTGYPRSEMHAVAYLNGIHYIGYISNQNSYRHIYCQDNMPFTNYGYTNGPIAYYSTLFLYNDTLCSLNSNYSDIYFWNPIFNTWFSKDLPYKIDSSAYEPTAVEYDGYLYIIGGGSSSSRLNFYRTRNYQIVNIQNEKAGTIVRGNNSIADGDYSYARGSNCVAAGNNSITEGIDASALFDFQKIFTGSLKYGGSKFSYGLSSHTATATTNSSPTPAYIDGRYGCCGIINFVVNSTSDKKFTFNIKIDSGGIYLFSATGYCAYQNTNIVIKVCIIMGNSVHHILNSNGLYMYITSVPSQEYNLRLTEGGSGLNYYSTGSNIVFSLIRLT